MKNKVYTTFWIDAITYIVIPIILLLGTINVITNIFSMSFHFYNIIVTIIEIIFLVFYGTVAYYTHKRYKKAYSLFGLLIWVTAIRAAFEFANTRAVNDGDNIFLMFGLYLVVAYFVWVLPNKAYLEKRKEIFRVDFPPKAKKEEPIEESKKEKDTLKDKKKESPKEKEESSSKVEKDEQKGEETKEEKEKQKEEETKEDQETEESSKQEEVD